MKKLKMLFDIALLQINMFEKKAKYILKRGAWIGTLED